ncbi:MAG: hypothetical protein QNJ49_07530 [Mastigocoleus sp. MO_167.B18]|nr:hypothetical protein [Mastigocoleus sp. MO_167.B18]
MLTYPMLNGRKAEAAKNSVAGYGESLFEQVFQNRAAYSYYSQQLRNNLKEVKIEIVGDSPEFHALHWEAMRDKDLPRPLAVDCVMVRKRVTKAANVSVKPNFIQAISHTPFRLVPGAKLQTFTQTDIG